ncbi:type VI secretion protein IcmF/TssM N-terminal domain-containing protein [Desulfatiferula olefinivorans]
MLLRLFFLLMTLIVLIIPILLSVRLDRGPFPGLLVSLGIVSLTLMVLFFRALWLRHREKKFIDGILEHPDPGRSGSDKQLSNELARRFKQVVGELKTSRLKSRGNPLYVLPWFMLIGESGSGKTTAITNSRLSAGYTTLPRAAGVSGTKNCDWWFFDQAIIIDTAGRYAVQPDETSDSAEWRLFLSQLARYRKKEPLNGLVVTVSADRILTAAAFDLAEEGQKIRLRIQELMQCLGASFPVYLLMTKCDLIHGMREFCDVLPAPAHDQAFGFLDLLPDQDRNGFLDRAFDALGKRIRRIRLRLAHAPGREKVNPDLLLFPEEFHRLKEGLTPFVAAAFGQSTFQEAPLLRGMYFTSGRQSGKPLSHFMQSLNLSPRDSDLTPSDKSYFLHDFFSLVLPGDRSLGRPTQRTKDVRRKTRITGLAAFALCVALLCGLLSFSFALTLSTVKQVHRDFAGPPTLSGDVIVDLNTLETMRQMVLTIERRNRSRWLPRFGLRHGDAAEKDMKALYCRSFFTDFLGPRDRDWNQTVLSFDAKTPGDRIGTALSLYARRIGLMEGFEAGHSIDEAAELPGPDFRPLSFDPNAAVIPEVLTLLDRQYRHALAWETPDNRRRALAAMKDRFKHLLIDRNLPLDFLVTWANTRGASITLEDFWKGGNRLKDERTIPPAYTVDGFGAVAGFLDELEGALDQPLLLETRKTAFLDTYRRNYLDTWGRFARQFPEGAFTLTGREQHQAAVRAMAGPSNPYFVFLDRLSDEISPGLTDGEPPPSWVDLALSLTGIRHYEAREGEAESSGAAATLAKKGARLLGRAGRLATASAPAPDLMVHAEPFKRYRDAMAAMARACGSDASAFHLASQVFAEDPTGGQSSHFAARRASEDLKAALSAHQDERGVFVRLLDGPVDYLWSRSVRGAACRIQAIWDETVLAEIQGVHDPKQTADMLLGKDGLVKAFTAGPGASFIGRDSRRGYFAKKVDGETMPFRPEFLSFLTRGAWSARSAQSLYKVKIDGLPTDANADAAMMPHVTKLELQCATGAQSLDNYNYPVSHTFEWSPDECGDVSLSILIGPLSLKKTYTGFRPFARFLKDFDKGGHTFYRMDFPDQGPELKRMNIKFIKVKYRISGGGPVMTLLNMEAGKPPGEIVSCSN